MQARTHRRRSTRGVVAGPRGPLLVVLVAALAIALAEIALIGAQHPPFAWLLGGFAVVGLVTVATGLWLWDRRPSNRTGALVVVLGMLELTAAAGNTGNAWLMLLGVLAAEAPLAALLHIVLAFPSGVVRERTGRALLVALYTSSIALQVPQYVFLDDPSTFSWLRISGHAEWVGRSDHVQSIVSSAIMVGAAIFVLLRRVRATQGAEQRRALGLVYGYGTLSLLLFPASANLIADALGWDVYALFQFQLALLLLVPFVFAGAIFYGGFARTFEITELGRWLAQPEGRRPTREAIAEALGDPSLQLLHRVAGGWVDGEGRPMALPDGTNGRGVVTVPGQDGRSAALVYDTGLHADPGPVRVAGEVVALAIDHERLAAELRASEREVRASRRRLMDEGAQIRRQMAQDLHDGVQNRLVLAAMHAGALEGDGAARVRDEIDEAISALRQFVRGLMPPLLEERGMLAAVTDLAESQPLPVELTIGCQPDDPPPLSVEISIYFVVSEALTNVVKHADASRVEVDLRVRDDVFHLRIADDGCGGADPTGFGLQIMESRVLNLNGALTITSPPGQGTTIVAAIPCGS